MISTKNRLSYLVPTRGGEYVYGNSKIMFHLCREILTDFLRFIFDQVIKLFTVAKERDH